MLGPILIDAFGLLAKGSSPNRVSIIARTMTDDTTSPDDAPQAPLADLREVRILISTIPPGKARRVAGMLVEEHLAACVNLVPGLRSIYRWKSDICDEPETLLVIKTTPARLEAATQRLTELHPYELPEILTLSAEAASAGYLAWLAAATEGPTGS